MDWQLAIERNREALKRIVAALIAMAGIADARTHLSRRLHNAALRLLRPAESATRRLVIVAARGLSVELPPLRPRGPKKRSALVRNGGTGIVIPAGYRVVGRTLVRQAARPKPSRLSLPLFDPLSRLAPRTRSAARSSGVPRIAFFGYGAPAPVALRPPPAPDDPISAVRLTLRVEALGRALDDLPGQARRFALRSAIRLRANAARDLAGGPRRFQPVSPLKPGRPPGALRKPTHEVHEVLADLQYFARVALERRDTS